MATVRVRHPDGAEHDATLAGEVLTFGKLGENDLVLDGMGVSRRHGRFFVGGDGRWWIEDLNSTNGIMVGGRYVSQHRLRHADSIAVGELILTFLADEPSTSEMSTGSVTITDAARPAQSVVERSATAMGAIDRERLSAVYEISKRLIDQRDTNGLVDEAATALISALGAEVVVFGLTRDPQRESDRVLVRTAPTRDTEVTLSGSVVRRAVEDRQAVLVADTGSDDQLKYAQSIVEGDIRSAMCVPMMRGEEVTGFIYVDKRRGAQLYQDDDLQFACALGAIIGTAIENIRLHEADLIKQRLEAELAGARRVQQAIMPSDWPEVPGWDIHGRHETCHEVGGDYYDAIVTADGLLWLFIADVCGKGAPAALLASSMHTAVHALVPQCPSPGQLLTRLNELLLQREVELSFVTFLAAVVTPGTGSVLFASAGHPYPIYVSEKAPASSLTMETGLMLGVSDEAVYEETKWAFPDTPGTLFLYTDGASETFNDEEQQFAEEGLLRTLSGCASSSAQDAIEAVLRDTERFRGGRARSDDLTLLACRRIPAP